MNLFRGKKYRVWYTYVNGVVYFWSIIRNKWMPTTRGLDFIVGNTTLVGKMLHMKYGMQHIQF